MEAHNKGKFSLKSGAVRRDRFYGYGEYEGDARGQE
jgi:hypothetical protein